MLLLDKTQQKHPGDLHPWYQTFPLHPNAPGGPPVHDTRPAPSIPKVIWRPTGAATITYRIHMLLLILAYSFHYVKAWRHAQNQKYITYCTVVREGSTHGHKLHV